MQATNQRILFDRHDRVCFNRPNPLCTVLLLDDCESSWPHNTLVSCLNSDKVHLLSFGVSFARAFFGRSVASKQQRADWIPMIRLHVSIEHDGSAEYLFQFDETGPTVGRVSNEPISIETLDGSAIVEIRIGDKVQLNLDGLSIPADVRDVDVLP